MFDKNQKIIILLISVLIITYFINCYEGFAVINDEAIANIASIYNKDNMALTNLNVTNDLNFPVDSGKTKMTLKSAPGNKILIEREGKAPFYVNDGINIGAWNNWSINNDGNAYFGSTISSPTIDTINAKNSSLETRISALEGNTVKKNDPFILYQKNTHSASDTPVIITDYWLLRASGTEGANYGVAENKNFYIRQ